MTCLVDALVPIPVGGATEQTGGLFTQEERVPFPIQLGNGGCMGKPDTNMQVKGVTKPLFMNGGKGSADLF